MDFFTAQDHAWRRSRWLTGAFLVAVVVQILVVCGIVHIALGPGLGGPVDPRLLGLVAAATAAIVLGASWLHAHRLRAGGAAVAALVGGRRIAPGTDSLAERKLVNVIEEMAIAAGIPVPAVFVLDDESGINAFAAGLSPTDAVIAVTSGALLRLDRDELRALVAHEAAHILNGDMRVNTRLVGLLHGLLLPGILGRVMLSARAGAGARLGKPAWVAAGGVLVVVGELGFVLGRVIQAAVSRQRELLADASAIQFTRDPSALASVLRRIGGLSFGSRMTHPRAGELAHLFLAEGVRPPWLFPFATHPPLVDRIRRIDPTFDGTFEPTPTPPRPRLIDRFGGDAPGAPAFVADRIAGDVERIGVAAILATIGEPGVTSVDRIARFLDSLPPELREGARDPASARAILLALLLSDEPDAATDQRKVAGVYDDAIADEAARLALIVRELGPSARVPLLELTLPALQSLPADDARRFRRAALEVIRAGGRGRIFDLAVMRVLARRLAGASAQGPAGTGGIPSLRPLRDDVEVLLSAVARAGAAEDETIARAQFEAGCRLLPRDLALRLLPPAETRLANVDSALSRLEAAAPVLRRRVLEACIGTITADGILVAEEIELVRAAAEALDLPMPPVLLAGATAQRATSLPT
jgi:Zn-dependent protease with chaperone function